MAQMTRSVGKVVKMRILAVPLTSHSHLTGQHTYYHFQTSSPSEEKGKSSATKWVVGKAAELWAGFGKAPEGSWKYRTFKYGERLVDRIDFEELALHSMDPSLGPSLVHYGRSSIQIEEQEKNQTQIPFVYPSFFAQRIAPLNHLHALLRKRTPNHRRGFYFWMLVSPLTAPFMIIPIIPNLPFFFCAWRSWHHFKAYRASSYLEGLIKHGLIHSEASSDMDRIYANSAFSPHMQDKKTISDTNEPHILKREAIPQIVALFGLPSSAEKDLLRALDQTELRLSKGRS